MRLEDLARAARAEGWPSLHRACQRPVLLCAPLRYRGPEESKIFSSDGVGREGAGTATFSWMGRPDPFRRISLDGAGVLILSCRQNTRERKRPAFNVCMRNVHGAAHEPTLFRWMPRRKAARKARRVDPSVRTSTYKSARSEYADETAGSGEAAKTQRAVGWVATANSREH